MQQSIIEVAVPSPVRQGFDYLTLADTSNYPIGARVQVPFGHQNKLGIIVDHKSESTFPREKLKAIHQLLDAAPLLPQNIIELCRFASGYYHHSLGEILISALPKLLREGKAAEIRQQRFWKITQAGKDCDIDAALRAKSQAESLRYFKENHLVSSQTIKLLGIKTSILNALCDKGFLETYTIDKYPKSDTYKPNPPTLTTEQKIAIESVTNYFDEFNTFLLDGITGSGKTEVYLQLIAKKLHQGKQCLVLIPEIGLTPQTVSRFQKRFNTMIVVLHSALNDNERCDAWLLAQRGIAKIVIGTRSALFTPMPDLGLIIIDEEHDTSFKQQDSFRYSARDIAIMRAKSEKFPIILGSATASLETLYNAQRGRYQWLRLTKRAGNATQPHYHLIDLKRNKPTIAGLSEPLIKAMQSHLAQNNQVLLFINRRGYAPVLMCQDCGFMLDCKYCDSHMTMHFQTNNLHCHHCGYACSIPRNCANCNSTQLIPIGVGTEKVEHEIQNIFQNTHILRIDRDSTRRKDALKNMLEIINKGDACIMIGTQMLAKGHHFPKVTLVGIINADNGLYNPDFRSSEKLGQLVLQVAGRSGRAEAPGEVFIQTLHPENPLLVTLIEQGYNFFAQQLLTERAAAQLPPFTHLALLRAEASQQSVVVKFIDSLKLSIQGLKLNGVIVLGPIPAALPKKAGKFRYHLLFQASSRKALQKFLHSVLPIINQKNPPRSIRWSIDVDPLDVVS